MKVLFVLVLSGICWLQCQKPTPSAAQLVVDEAIASHGLNGFDRKQVAWDFRNKHYTATFQRGKFRYEKEHRDSLQTVDVITNDELFREQNGTMILLTARDSNAIREDVNSVIYFSLLPHFLNDPAVIKADAGKATLAGQPYDKVMVTFEQQGGGRDFQDTFVYWFHEDKRTLDYLAYNYLDAEGGARFRKAINPVIQSGIRFQDYINYEPTTKRRDILNFDLLYEQDSLKELSRIELKNISVTLK